MFASEIKYEANFKDARLGDFSDGKMMEKQILLQFRSRGSSNQGCQIVYFQTKDPN
jgi:hypothetical protein